MSIEETDTNKEKIVVKTKSNFKVKEPKKYEEYSCQKEQQRMDSSLGPSRKQKTGDDDA